MSFGVTTKQKPDCQGGLELRLKCLETELKPSLTVGLLLGPVAIARGSVDGTLPRDVNNHISGSDHQCKVRLR